jgi:hypothetical protein
MPDFPPPGTPISVNRVDGVKMGDMDDANIILFSPDWVIGLIRLSCYNFEVSSLSGSSGIG